jgi:hypothetical protein
MGKIMSSKNIILVSDSNFKLILVSPKPNNPKGINTEEGQKNLLNMIRIASKFKEKVDESKRP